MPPRSSNPVCKVEESQLTIKLHRPCEDCHEANTNIYTDLQSRYGQLSSTEPGDKTFSGIPGPTSSEGLPPSYQQATEQPPSYARAVTEEQPVTYDNVMMAIATFQPEEIVRAMHTFRASQLSLLPALLNELRSLEHRVSKAKRRLYRAEDIGFCDEVVIRLTREQRALDSSLQQGRRYLDATVVLKHGLDKYQNLARESTKVHNYNQSRLYVKAASEHADRLLEMEIQLSRPGQQPRHLAGQTRQQLYPLEKVVQALEARTTSRAWAVVQVATRSNFDVHC
ncbi:unnamed protein product [Aureobasidium uvarum]|uniref:Uncharacterized protein n=1 Tax=Aureobasidium uvarum TaxID=2773716 RepID=A0A9N8KI03_9PEZI|nr:unnamed protein product [Aureobasidium uvarum]